MSVRRSTAAFLLPALCLAGLTGLAGPGRAASGHGSAPVRPAAMRTLEPGGNITLRQSVPVNIVLVGYHRSAVGVGLRSQLPSASTPVVRVPLLYGLNGRPLACASATGTTSSKPPMVSTTPSSDICGVPEPQPR